MNCYEPNRQVCDATKFNQGTTAGFINIIPQISAIRAKKFHSFQNGMLALRKL